MRTKAQGLQVQCLDSRSSPISSTPIYAPTHTKHTQKATPPQSSLVFCCYTDALAQYRATFRVELIQKLSTVLFRLEIPVIKCCYQSLQDAGQFFFHGGISCTKIWHANLRGHLNTFI